jgi:hypothetical protein
LFWFEKHCEDEGITGFEFVELSPKGQAKNNRIKRGLLQLLAGEIYLAPNTRSLVITQALEWDPLRVNNTDDIIDPIGYVEEVMRDYDMLIVKNTFDTEVYAGTATHAATISF